MVKPPPTPNTFPVEKKKKKLQIKAESKQNIEWQRKGFFFTCYVGDEDEESLSFSLQFQAFDLRRNVREQSLSKFETKKVLNFHLPPLFINKRAKASIRPKDTRRFNLNRCANPTVPTQKIQRIKIPPHKNETLLRSNDQGASSWNEVVMPLC
jgi:hypothetical protein